MKKALVLLCVLVLGVGMLGLAAGKLSGTAEFGVEFGPGPSFLSPWSPIQFRSISMDLALNYTVGAWVFGSSTGFDEHGYSSQSFTATGILGAFQFSSTLAFVPSSITTLTYDYSGFWYYSGYLYSGYWGECWYGQVEYLTDTVTAPEFDEWQATGKVSIAGVTLEGLFYLEGYAGQATATPYAFWSDGIVVGALPAHTHLVGVSPTIIESAYDALLDSLNFPDVQSHSLCGFVPTPTVEGSGWRFMVTGTAGELSFTSLTYFNLVEPMAEASCGACGYSLAKAGSGFEIAAAGCGVAFSEEYLLIEGFSIACATIDAALKITCDGFDSVSFLVEDIPLIGGIALDALVTFTIDTKTFTIAPCLTLANTCFTIEAGLGTSGTYQIDSLNIYGISFEQKWNGVTFSSKTAFDTENSCLFGEGGTKVVDENNSYVVMVPVTGLSTQLGPVWDPGCNDDVCDFTCENICLPSIGNDPTGDNGIVGFFTPWCFESEYYQVWEEFTIAVEGDSCCGGAFDFSATTSFGQKKEIMCAGWHYVFDNGTALGDAVGATTWHDFHIPACEPPCGTFETGDDCDYISLADAQCDDPTLECYECLAQAAYYRDAASDTLFQWVKTDLSLSLGIGSAWTLDFGMVIDVYGWESLTLGVKFAF